MLHWKYEEYKKAIVAYIKNGYYSATDGAFVTYGDKQKMLDRITAANKEFLSALLAYESTCERIKQRDEELAAECDPGL